MTRPAWYRALARELTAAGDDVAARVAAFAKVRPTLDGGSHSSPADGLCLLEAVAFVAGEHHSDSPACACPVLAAYGRSLNDTLGDEERQRLTELVPLLLNTRSTPDVELRRAYELVNSSLRQQWPLVLEAVALSCDAAALEGVPLGPKFRELAERFRALEPMSVDELLAYAKGPITYEACVADDVAPGVPFAPWGSGPGGQRDAERSAAKLNASGGWGNNCYWTFDTDGVKGQWGVAAKGPARADRADLAALAARAARADLAAPAVGDQIAALRPAILEESIAAFKRAIAITAPAEKVGGRAATDEAGRDGEVQP